MMDDDIDANGDIDADDNGEDDDDDIDADGDINNDDNDEDDAITTTTSATA